MCQYNFLITKEKIDVSEIKEIASEFGLNYTEVKLNFSNFGQLRTFLTTTKDCDCGSVLGKKYCADSLEPNWNKERNRLERKRFSKRRIELLLKQKQKEFANKNANEIQIELNETKRWSEFMNDQGLKNKLSEIGILYHHFRGDLENEKIKIENNKTHSVGKINSEFLKNIKENELNWIKL